jgi:hypothetical protein
MFSLLKVEKSWDKQKWLILLLIQIIPINLGNLCSTQILGIIFILSNICITYNIYLMQVLQNIKVYIIKNIDNT